MNKASVLAALAIGVTGGVVATAAAKPVATKANVVQITALKSKYAYAQTKVTAKAGQLTIVFTNHSSKQHNVSLEQGETEYGATVTIPTGRTSTILTLKKGVYHYYSSYGRDEDKGMAGTLTVT